jgi:hypothetical protein
MLEVKRSAAKVAWHLLCNGIIVATKPTKAECNELKATFQRKYGLASA